MISVLPCSSASRRECVWGASGFALITFARFQAGCRPRRSAAPRALAKFGMRSFAPGNRDTPSFSIAAHTERRIASLDLSRALAFGGVTSFILPRPYEGPAHTGGSSPCARIAAGESRQAHTRDGRLHVLGRPARPGARAPPFRGRDRRRRLRGSDPGVPAHGVRT